MNKKLITIIMIVVLLLIVIGLTIAEDEIKKDKEIKIELKVIENLEKYGITNPIISECFPIDENYCMVKIYQENGINKELKINYHYCQEYENITEDLFLEIIAECIQYKTLTDIEIEKEIEKQTKDLFKKISDVKDKRDSLINETLSSKLNIIIGEE